MKKFKQIVAFALSTIILLCYCSFYTSATQYKTADNITYIVYSNGLSIAGCTDDVVGELVIPAEVDGKKVISLSKNSSWGNNVTSIVLPETITSIPTVCFSNTPNIKKITLPSSLKTIQEYAFSGSGLEEINIPGSVNKIYGYAFFNCDNLNKVDIANGVNYISSGAFYSCENLKFISLPDSVHISEDAFDDTGYYNDEQNWSNGVLYIDEHLIEAKESISVETEEGVSGRYYVREGTKTIAEEAFSECTNLNSIVIPDSVSIIEEDAFCRDNSPLKEISLGKGIKYIGSFAFYCKNLKKVNYRGDLKSWCEIQFQTTDSNPLYNAEAFYLNDKVVTDIEIPYGTESIGDNAFCCKAINSVVIPNSVTKIGQYAFRQSNIKEITIPNSVTNIDFSPFDDCEQLTDVYYEGTKSRWYSINRENDWESETFTVHFNSYNEVHGWPLTNSALSYGYPDGYRIPYKRYFELYGINIKSLIDSFINVSATSFTKKLDWKGSCFGLALLSCAEYYDLVDLSGLFNNKGTNLYDFGYEKIVTNSVKQQCYSIEGNEDAIAAIERAFLAQDSVEFKKCETFKNDSNFSNLINYLSSNYAGPILVTFCGSNGMGHTMVLTNDIKPKLMTDGYYYISTYDPNAPVNNGNLNNPTKEYNYGDSILMVNPETGSWKYYANGKVQCENSYYTFSLDTKSIWFYNISYLNNSFFTDELSLWTYDVKLNISASNTTIKNKNNEKVFEMKDGLVEYIADGYDFKYMYTSDGSKTNNVTFYSNKNVEFTIITDAKEIIALDNNYVFLLNLNNKTETVINFEKGSVKILNLDSSLEETQILAQNTSKDYAIKLSDKTIEGKIVTLSVSEETPTVTGSNPENIVIEAEGIEKNDVIISNFDPCAGGHKMQFVDSLNSTCNTTGMIKHYVCVICGKFFEDAHGKRPIHDIVIPATGHTAGEWKTTVDATCIQNGKRQKECINCGEVMATEELPLVSHSPGEWIITVHPTQTLEGKKEQKCTVCGTTLKQESVDKLPAGKVRSVSIENFTMEYKDSATITPNIEVDAGVGYTVSYNSSDSSVIQIDENGNITTRDKGSATITVTVTDEHGNTVADTCEVNVKYKWWQWIIVIVLFGWIWY